MNNGGTIPLDDDKQAATLIPGGQANIKDLKLVVVGTGINFLGSMVRTVLTFGYAVFLAIFLAPNDVGLFFLGFSVTTLLGTVATMGLDMGMLRFSSLYSGEGDRARLRGTMAGSAAIVIPSGLIAGLFLYLAAGFIAGDIFGKPELGPVLRLFAPAVPLLAMAKLFNAGTQGLKRMQYQVYSRDLGEHLAKFLVSGGLLAIGLGLSGMVAANVAALSVAVLLSAFFLYRLEPVFGAGREKKFEQRRLVAYSVPLAVSTMLSLMLMWTDTLILGYFGSAEDVGTYSLAMRLAVVGGLILLSFNTMFAPLASDFYNRGELSRLQTLLRLVNKWAMGLSLPFFAGLAIFPEQALRIMGSEYIPGATALAILAIGQLVNSAAGPVGLLLMMCGRPRFVLVNNLAVFSIHVLLCLLLIPRYGVEGAALASAAALILFNVGALAGTVLLLKISPFGAGYAKVAASGAVSAALALSLKYVLASPWNVVAGLITFFGVYAASAWLTGRETEDDFILGALKAKARRG